MVAWMGPFLAALGTGVLSSWGVGGGTLLLVVMTLFLGVGHREAQAINLLFFLPTAAISLYFHREKGFLDRESFRQAAVPGAAASLAGALVSMAVDVSLLRKPFGLFLLYSGASMLLSARKKRPGEKSLYKSGETDYNRGK